MKNRELFGFPNFSVRFFQFPHKLLSFFLWLHVQSPYSFAPLLKLKCFHCSFPLTFQGLSWCIWKKFFPTHTHTHRPLFFFSPLHFCRQTPCNYYYQLLFCLVNCSKKRSLMLPHFGAGTSAPPPLTQQPVSPGHTLEISLFSSMAVAQFV